MVKDLLSLNIPFGRFGISPLKSHIDMDKKRNYNGMEIESQFNQINSGHIFATTAQETFKKQRGEISSAREAAIAAAQKGYRCSRPECTIKSFHRPVLKRGGAKVYVNHEMVSLICVNCNHTSECSISY